VVKLTIAEQVLQEFIIRITTWLGTDLIYTNYIHLQLWSVIHFLVAGLLFYLVLEKEGFVEGKKTERYHDGIIYSLTEKGKEFYNKLSFFKE